VVDERSAGFVALGVAKATGKPVILNCTSGTAVLNYYPAIAEAFYARVPLIVLTADRPPEKIDVWDGQAIRQKGVFANHIRAEFETPDTYEEASSFSAIADKVNAYFEKQIPGPIHINVPIREPFYADLAAIKSDQKTTALPNRKAEISLRLLQEHLGENFQGKNILVFNGMQSGEAVKLNVDCLACQTVEISDITSNIPSELVSWDAFLYSHIKSSFEKIETLKPDILITTGTTTVSKALKLFLKKHPPEKHIHLSFFNELGRMFDTEPLVVNPTSEMEYSPDEELVGMAMWSPFKKAWVEQVADFQKKFEQLDWNEFNEFSAVKTFLQTLQNDCVLHLANSMAVRYVSYLEKELEGKNILIRSNRGTSGIDGCTSTAVGEALMTKKPVYLITGDVAFLYDINALWNEKLPENLKIIILNNQGGRIFEMIDGPIAMGDAMRFQVTEQQGSLKKWAKQANITYFKARNTEKLNEKSAQLTKAKSIALLEIISNPPENSRFYSQFKAT
jgi:2-succinyl-5-enolpyruvyl-6-hydroxy-3-cyclohexene-1-carboxylate synthase